MDHMIFQYPWVFVLLLLIICIFKCPLSVKKIVFPHLHLFVQKSNWIHKEKLLLSLVYTLLITALASPISFDAIDTQNKKGRDLVFAIDTSGSMDESGYSQEQIQQSKFTILRQIIQEFVQNRHDDNVGIVVFGSFAFSAVPITYDMHSLSYLLDFLEVGMAGDSTAIGDGLARSLAMLEKSMAKNKVIVLLSDGYQNGGSTKIGDMITKAKEIGVKIYTIGIGKDSEYDKALLEHIAKDTNGISFGASDAQTLQDVYKKLDTLEPSAIRSQNYLNKQMLFTYPLAGAILLLFYLLRKRSVL